MLIALILLSQFIFATEDETVKEKKQYKFYYFKPEKEGATAFYNPINLAIFNSLKVIEQGKGYLVNMRAPVALSVDGVAAKMTALQLKNLPKSGWNMIGCPYQSVTNLTSIFTATNTDTVKDFNGYWIPNDALSTISTLAPGKGYYWMKK